MQVITQSDLQWSVANESGYLKLGSVYKNKV